MPRSHGSTGSAESRHRSGVQPSSMRRRPLRMMMNKKKESSSRSNRQESEEDQYDVYRKRLGLKLYGKNREEEMDDDDSDAMDRKDGKEKGKLFRRAGMKSTDRENESGGEESDDNIRPEDDEEISSDEDMQGGGDEIDREFAVAGMKSLNSTVESESDEEADVARTSADHLSLLSAIHAKGPRKQISNSDLRATNVVSEDLFANLQKNDGPTMDDLLRVLKDAPDLVELAKPISDLQKRKRAHTATGIGSVRERELYRKAAYDEASQVITSDFSTQVRQFKEAEHIKFEPPQPPEVTTTVSSMAAKFQPMNEMELQIQEALKQGKADSQQSIADAEGFILSQLSAEEVERRRQELLKMRSFLFHYERKMKRAAKIKSRKYRRLHKRDREQNQLSVEELHELDPALAKREVEKRELERIKERLTMRHRNTSKWIKRALNRGIVGNNDQAREAIDEQLAIGERLRQKMQSLNSDSESDGKSSDSDSDERNPMKEEKSVLPSKGLFGMKFMRESLEKKQSLDEELLQELEKDLENIDQENSDLENESDDQQSKRDLRRSESPGQVDSNKGDSTKLKFGKVSFSGKPSLSSRFESNDDRNGSDDENGTASTGLLNSSLLTAKSGLTSGMRVRLQGGISVDVPSIEQSKVVVSEESQLSTLVCHEASSDRKTKKSAKKRRKQKRSTSTVQAEDVNLEVGSSSVMETSVVASKRSKKNTLSASSSLPSPSVTVSSVEKVMSTFANQRNPFLDALPTDQLVSSSSLSRRQKKIGKKEEKSALKMNSSQAFEQSMEVDDDRRESGEGVMGLRKQQDLVRLAFAQDTDDGPDEGQEEFAEEKRRLVDRLVKKPDVDYTPGWGSWSGAGINEETKPLPSFIAKARARAQAETKLLRDSRKDAKLKHVILSERKDRHIDKLLVRKLPFPFQREEEYQRTLQVPLGREWTTEKTFRRSIVPEVSVRAGTNIQPVQRSKTSSSAASVPISRHAARKDRPLRLRSDSHLLPS